MADAAPPARETTYRLFWQQGLFFNDQAPNVAAVTGIGAGKTLVGALKAYAYVQAHPKSLGLVTAPTYVMLQDATLRTLEQVFPPGTYTLNRADMVLKYRNGAEILLRSTDNPDRLRGPNLAWAWMDEAAQAVSDAAGEEAFRIIQGRLRQPDFPHQLWITTTPKGFNWLYRYFVQDTQAKEKGYSVHRWQTKDNPHLPAGFLKQLEGSYDAQFALQELLGEFVMVGGNPYFDHARLREMLGDCREPVSTASGAVSVWRMPVGGGKYAAGGDLAWGETGAYSCLELLDWQTGEQVAAIHGRLPMDEMALLSVELCKRYNQAFALIEANGEGVNVVTRMVELGYGGRMYHREGEMGHEVGPQRERLPKRPGWITSAATRPVLLGELAQAVRERGLVVRDRLAVQELLTFNRDEKGRPGPAEGQYADRVMALGLAIQARKYAIFSGAHAGQAPAVVANRRW